MNLAAVEQRLVAGKPAGLRKVGGAADLAAIKAGRVPAPALYLLPMDEKASDMDVAGDLIQRVDAGFAVVFAVANKGDAGGAKAVVELEPFRDAVKQLLMGWTIPGYFDQVAFSAGRLLSFDDGVVFWMDEYKTAYIQRTA